MIVARHTQFILWIFSAICLLLTANQLRRTAEIRHYLVFFIYVVFVALHMLLMVGLGVSGANFYFYCFYSGMVVSIGLSFAVLYEASSRALSSPTFKLNRSTYFELCAILFALAVAVSVFTNVKEQVPFVRARLLIEQTLRIVQVTIILVFLGASSFFGFLWRRMEFGIIAGYGFFAVMELTALLVRRMTGPDAHDHFVITRAAAFGIASSIWLVYSLMKEPTGTSSDIPTEELWKYWKFAGRYAK